jgi:glyoxylase-like metal-dependent hydrolase (beta-lactamase superfamily II)
MTMNTPTRRLAPTLVIGIALIVAGCDAQDQGAATEPAAGPAAGQDQFEMVNISGGLYQAGVRGMGGHTTVLLVTDEGVILGDPIRADFSEWLKAELRERFDSQVEYVLYSHHHPDHASGGSVFADTAMFIGHENMVTNLTRLPSNSTPMDANGNGMIERSEASGGFLAGFDRDDTNQDGVLTSDEVNAPIHPLDVTYRDQMTVSLGGRTVELHHSPPAHSDDMTVLRFPEEGVVFAVDFLQIGRLPGGLTGFLAGYPVDSYETAVGAVEALDFDTVIQGHSEIIGTRADVAEFMTLLRTTEAEVAAAIAAGMSLEETLDSVMLSDYTDWLLYETRRPQLVGNMYEFLTQE